MSASDRKPCATQRQAARDLLKLVRDGDASAIERAKKYLRDFDPERRFSLMTAQFIVSREEGFKSWSDMLRERGGNE